MYQNSLKTLQAVVIAITLFVMTSCKKNDANVDDAVAAKGTTVTADDASSVIQYAISSQTAGLATTLSDVSSLAYTRNSASYCGKTTDSTVTKSKTSTNGLYSYAYTQNWSWLLACSTLKVPASLTYKTTLKGNYSSPKVTSNDQGDASLTVSGLEVSKSTYAVNGSYNRSGSETVAVSSTKNITSSIQMTLSDVQVNKSTLQIQAGGTAALVITGKSSTGQSYSFSGTIKFTGNGSATITINGTDYPITI